MKNKAFTVVEIMIVVVIIGLLSAMAIPAFQKAKVNALAKMVASGQTVPDNEMEYLRNHADKIQNELRSRIDLSSGRAIYVAPSTVRFDRTIVIDGKAYGLVPIN